jgi:hypothetical protein
MKCSAGKATTARPDRKGCMSDPALAPSEPVERFIVILRAQKVILDRDLASLYRVSTTNLNKAVTRNLDRFPADFMFQLTADELRNLMFQSGTSNWGGTRKPPRAFTEQGVAMLSSVLRGPRAAQVNIEIMRAFVRLRQILQTNAELASKVAALEKKYDGQFRVVFDAIRELMAPTVTPSRRIGFR